MNYRRITVDVSSRLGAGEPPLRVDTIIANKSRPQNLPQEELQKALGSSRQPADTEIFAFTSPIDVQEESVRLEARELLLPEPTWKSPAGSENTLVPLFLYKLASRDRLAFLSLGCQLARHAWRPNVVTVYVITSQVLETSSEDVQKGEQAYDYVYAGIAAAAGIRG